MSENPSERDILAPGLAVKLGLDPRWGLCSLTTACALFDTKPGEIWILLR